MRAHLRGAAGGAHGDGLRVLLCQRAALLTVLVLRHERRPLHVSRALKQRLHAARQRWLVGHSLRERCQCRDLRRQLRELRRLLRAHAFIEIVVLGLDVLMVVEVAEADFVSEKVDEREVVLLTLRTRSPAQRACVASRGCATWSTECGGMRGGGGSWAGGGERGGESRPGVWLS